jgi:hypothetical protein
MNENIEEFIPKEFDFKELPEFFSACIFGKRRSGKGILTNWLVPHLMNKHKWTECHIFSPTCLMPSQKMEDWQFVPNENKHEVFDEEKLQSIIDKQTAKAVGWGERKAKHGKNYKEEQPRLLIILDDLLAPRSKSKSGADGIFGSKAVSDLFVSGRHKYVTVITLLQSISASVPPVCRKNCDLIAYFRSPNKSDQETLAYDYLSLYGLPLKDMKQLIYKITEEKHSCLIVNVTALQWSKTYGEFLFKSTKHKPIRYKGPKIGKDISRREIPELNPIVKGGVPKGKRKEKCKIY